MSHNNNFDKLGKSPEVSASDAPTEGLRTAWPVEGTMNYEAIKKIAKARKCKATDLIALAPQNDPFYVGAPAQKIAAEWFAGIFDGFGITSSVHIRRIHYRMISQEKPFVIP